MGRKFITCTAVISILAFIGVVRSYASATYVSEQRCSSKVCHGGDTLGNQVAVWQKSAHARAYKTLGTDRAKELAAKAGVKEDPQKSPKCLKCHVTAYGAGKGSAPDIKPEDGIQCQACHGPGGDYASLKIMNRPKYKEDPKGQHKLFLDAGGVIPTEKDCVRCHNSESPAYKKFVFADAIKKVAHPVAGK